MRVMIIDVDGLRVEMPLTTTIDSLIKTYNELKEMDSEMNIVEYREEKVYE